MIEVNSNEEFREIIANTNKCVVFFGSKNCHHCTTMSKFLNTNLSAYPGIVFAHVETTRVPVKDLQGVPVFLLYHDGELVGHQVGAGERNLDGLIVSLMNNEDP